MAKTNHGDSVYRYALYVGSFSVDEEDHRGRTNKVQRELEALRVHKKERRVTIIISVKGIKICSDDQSVVFMAHALRRISYATCDAAHRQFAFLAREPLDEASNQYCHVFVSESTTQTEELNRIVGDAFQLAYIQQLLAKQQHNRGASKNHGTRGSVDSGGFVIPRLCDRHPQWPVSQGLHTNGQHSILNVLELPPPPTCPPPPINQSTRQNSFSPSSSRIHSPTRPRPADVRQADKTLDNQGDQFKSDCLTGPHECTASQADDQASSVVPAQPCELSLRRRAVVRRDNEVRLSGIADAQIIGGSTRQPRRRQGLSWTHLFSSARHSAFIPGTQKNQPTAVPDLFELLDSRKPPPSKTNIFFDLRTFAGGSPVVALKERLDAQAVADAKASAFAEAAAVLAAAKQANENCAGSNSSISNSFQSDPRSRPDACSSTDNSTSPCSTTSAHSEPGRFAVVTADQGEAPPTPPIRLHSLRRTQNRVANSSPTLRCPKAETITERLYDEADIGSSALPSLDSRLHSRDSKSCTTSRGHLGGQGQRSLSPSARSPVLNRFTIDQQPSHESFNPQSLNASSRRFSCVAPATPSQWSHSNSTQPIFVQDHRINRFSHKYSQDSSTKRPLHVAVTKAYGATDPSDSVHPNLENGARSGCVQARIVANDPCVMTTSTLSTETPTPTATPTPTPTQTPQPINHNPVESRNHVIWGSSEDVEFLKQAPWYQAHLPRDIAFELLSREEIGSFIVRNSVSHPDCCALSVRVPISENPTGIIHYLIQRTAQGVRLKGLEKWWPSLKALITHLTVIPEMLPCPLRLPQCISNPVFIQADRHLSKTGIRSHVDGPLIDQSNGLKHNDFILSHGASLSRPNPPALTSQRIPSNMFSPHAPVNTCVLSPHVSIQMPTVNGHGNTVPVKDSIILPNYKTSDETEHASSGLIVASDENESDDEEYQLLSDFSSILADLDAPTSNKILTSSS